MTKDLACKPLASRTNRNLGGWGPDYSYTSRKAYVIVREVLDGKEPIKTVDVEDKYCKQRARMWPYSVVEIIYTWCGGTEERQWFYCPSADEDNLGDVAKFLVDDFGPHLASCLVKNIVEWENKVVKVLDERGTNGTSITSKTRGRARYSRPRN